MKRSGAFAAIAACTLLGLAGTGPAAVVTVGSGSALDLGTGHLDLGCADLTVAGTLAAGSVGFDGARDLRIEPTGMLDGESAILQVTGDWDNAGSFVPGTSTVQLMDGCAQSSAMVVGDNTFANLELSTTSGKLYSLTAGSTQTVNQSLMLAGTAGGLLVLRSTVPGVVAFFDAQGSSSGDYVDVDDNDASAGNPILLDENSVAGSNTSGWTFGIPVPALGAVGATLLALALLWAAKRATAARSPGARTAWP